MASRLEGITDPAQRRHLIECSWMQPEHCTCRTRPDGSRYWTCKNAECKREGQVCGGYCRICFDALMEQTRKNMEEDQLEIIPHDALQLLAQKLHLDACRPECTEHPGLIFTERAEKYIRVLYDAGYRLRRPK